MSDSPKECPTCQSTSNVIRIVYGRPGPALVEQANQGSVRLGGCCIPEDVKHFHCKKCLKDF